MSDPNVPRGPVLPRATTIPSYLYMQYADDDDLQAFVQAYNDAAQTYVDWFVTAGLPFYPNLSGDLLVWVALGLYGQPKTQLSTAATAIGGPLDTETLDALPLDKFIPSTQTFYNLTDDVFKRILTWNFYKGDGKRFSITWLKRRVMRFLVGTNGIDPQPWNPGFTLGAETTAPIGVAIASHVVTVSIDQTLLSLITNVPANVLSLFKLAFQGGNLDLPAVYTYVCNIITGFDAVCRPNAISSESVATSQTTLPVTVTALGGTGNYTYAWTWPLFDPGANINSPSSASTTFTAPTLGRGQTIQGTARCTVTDTVSSLTASANCLVTFTCDAPSILVIEGGGDNGSLLIESGDSPLIRET